MTTTTEQLYGIILKIKRGKVNLDQLESEAKFEDDLGFDSLDTVEMTALVEKRFNISFTLEEMINVETVGQVIGWIEEKLGENQGIGQSASDG